MELFWEKDNKCILHKKKKKKKEKETPQHYCYFMETNSDEIMYKCMIGSSVIQSSIMCCKAPWEIMIFCCDLSFWTCKEPWESCLVLVLEINTAMHNLLCGKGTFCNSHFSDFVQCISILGYDICYDVLTSFFNFSIRFQAWKIESNIKWLDIEEFCHVLYTKLHTYMHSNTHISPPPGFSRVFLPSGHRSTSQRWASTFLNHPQHWNLVEKSLILKQWSTKNQLLNHNSTKNQPRLKLKCQSWKMVEIWLTVGWFLVELWLRSWFLVDHCFKINDLYISTLIFGWEIHLCP